jgi:predicted nucleotidyltransferase
VRFELSADPLAKSRNDASIWNFLLQRWALKYPEVLITGCSGWRRLQLSIKFKKSKLKLNMKPSLALATHRSEIREIVLAHRALNARVFGSVAQGLDTELSDLDILVDTTSETTLFDLGAIRYKLRNLLGVPVDVLTPGALPDSFRQTVIAQAQLI